MKKSEPLKQQKKNERQPRIKLIITKLRNRWFDSTVTAISDDRSVPQINQSPVKAEHCAKRRDSCDRTTRVGQKKCDWLHQSNSTECKISSAFKSWIFTRKAIAVHSLASDHSPVNPTASVHSQFLENAVFLVQFPNFDSDQSSSSRNSLKS
jgi:hypothetical protein